MDTETRRSIIRNIVHGILISKYHVPNFGYDKQFDADFGFNEASFGTFLSNVAAEVNSQLQPTPSWEFDGQFVKRQLGQSVTALIDAINDALGVGA